MLFSFLPWWIAYVNENWDKIVFIKNNDENNTATTRVTFWLFFFVKSLWSLARFNYVNFNQAALRAVKTAKHVIKLKDASFYRSFQSFQSLFGSMFSLVSIAV